MKWENADESWIIFKIPVDSSTSGHAPGESADSSSLKVGNTIHIIGNHSQRIRRVDEESFLSKNHVAILNEVDRNFIQISILLRLNLIKYHEQNNSNYFNILSNFNVTILKIIW